MRVFSFLIALLACGTCIYAVDFEHSPLFRAAKSIGSFNRETGLSPIECIYVINLDRRVDKWERTRDILRENELQATRVSAVDGLDLPEQLRRQLDGSGRLSPGQMGCFLSHISVWRHAFENDLGCIWICEDDIEVNRDVHELTKYIEELNRFDPDWDVFYTDTNCYKNYELIKKDSLYLAPDQKGYSGYFSAKFRRKRVTPNLVKLGMRWGTHSYVLSKRGIQKYINHFFNRVMYGPVDADMHYIVGLREYGPRVNIITSWQQSPYSDAGSG